MVNKIEKFGVNKLYRDFYSSGKKITSFKLTFRKQECIQTYEQKTYLLAIIFQEDKDSNK